MAHIRLGQTLQLHPSRAVPLYYSLALAIEQAIVANRVAIDDTLEPIAALGKQLKLSGGTIRRALRLLEERGIVERISRTTYKVVGIPTTGSERAATCKDFS
nr:GntR family transcriptional regulator [Rhodococcus sp. (in: high G+C Gram-positive bacteria)]